MEEDLDHREAIFRQVPFPVAYLAVARFPDILAYQFFRHTVAFDEVVDAGDDDFFIVRAVEDADFTPAGQGFIDAPHIVVIQFFRARFLEAVHFDASRIEVGKDVFDRTVFPGRIHGLQDDDQAVVIVGTELFL